MADFGRIKNDFADLNSKEDIVLKWSKIKGRNVSIAEAIEFQKKEDSDKRYQQLRNEEMREIMKQRPSQAPIQQKPSTFSKMGNRMSSLFGRKEEGLSKEDEDELMAELAKLGKPKTSGVREITKQEEDDLMSEFDKGGSKRKRRSYKKRVGRKRKTRRRRKSVRRRR
jgi:hypothetical protein